MDNEITDENKDNFAPVDLEENYSDGSDQNDEPTHFINGAGSGGLTPIDSSTSSSSSSTRDGPQKLDRVLRWDSCF